MAARLVGEEQPRLTALRERLWNGLEGLGGTHLNGAGSARIPGILNVSFEGVEGESLVTGLIDLAVSTGSACNSASAEPSYVLRALGRDTQLAQSSLRITVGRYTKVTDVDFAIEAVKREVTRLRTLSPASEDAMNQDGPLAADAPRANGAQLLADGSTSPGGAATTDAVTLTGEAGGPSQETWVRFHLTAGSGIVKAARFKAYGCPHTLAVVDWLTRRLPGRTRDDGPPGTPALWAEELSVPVERLGRLLVVEDALLACFARWPGGV
jgi:cysteine desulfurase